MGGWIVECDGEWVTMPLDGDWIVDTLEGRFPNKIMFKMDEDRFKSGFEKRAIVVLGKGEYVSLAYCGQGLTIHRYPTLARAIEAKRAIDGGGCGGGCVKVHILAYVDPTNSREAKEKANIRAYRERKAAGWPREQTPKDHGKPARRQRRRRCASCGVQWVDPPSSLCPGCEAYREHQV